MIDPFGPSSIARDMGFPYADARRSDHSPSHRPVSYTVWIENARRRHLAIISGPANADTIAHEIGARFGRLYEHLRALPGATTGQNVVVYHNDPAAPYAFRSDRGIRVDVGVECVLPRTSAPDIQAFVTPDGLVATTEHVGPYDRLAEAHSAVRSWCKANGWQLTGTSWEVYDHWSGDPERRRTAVYYPVR